MSRRNRIIVIVISVIQVALICLVISSIAEQGDRLYGFFFNRSFVQYLTLSVFSLITTLLGYRFLGYLRSRRQLQAAKKREDGWQDRARALTDQLHAVRRSLTKHGGGAAISCASRIAEEQKDKIRKSYEIINFLVCALPALGLFGTMLGLSDSLFTAFSGGAAGPEAVQQFVTALSTALDTTVLALACAMVIGGFAWLLNRLESGLSDQQGEFVRSLFPLENLATKLPEVKTAVSGDHYPVVVDTFRAELRALTAEIVAEARSNFEKLLDTTAESYRLNLDAIVKEIFSKQRAHEESMVEKIASHLADRVSRSINQVGTLIQKQNGRSTKDFTAGIRLLEKTLRKRTPDEVIIRYERDGNSYQEMKDVHT